MAFEGITSKLQGIFKKLTGKGKLSEKEVKEAMREIKLALLEADVNFAVGTRCRRRSARKPHARAADNKNRQRRIDGAHGRNKREARVWHD